MRITGGEIGELKIKTTYDPIELDQVAIRKKFIAATKYDSIKAALVGRPENFTVKAKADGGNNSLQNHEYKGEKTLELDAEEGNIDVTFLEER